MSTVTNIFEAFIATIIPVHLLMVRVGCLLADWLAEHPVTVGPLRRSYRLHMPLVLIGIGVTILVESGAFAFLFRVS
jgi:cadmium resistance protein CadD (predicted permease)